MGPQKSTWIRIPQQSNPNLKSVLADVGLKRKNSERTKEVEEVSVFVKKFRMEEEVLPVNMINQCPLAELLCTLVRSNESHKLELLKVWEPSDS